jgi:hypothetical protein
MTTIHLTDEQLELVRRAIMDQVVSDMLSPWPVRTLSSDAQTAVSVARESLGILDAIGWPRDESRAEWDARMHSAAAES